MLKSYTQKPKSRHEAHAAWRMKSSSMVWQTQGMQIRYTAASNIGIPHPGQAVPCLRSERHLPSQRPVLQLVWHTAQHPNACPAAEKPVVSLNVSLEKPATIKQSPMDSVAEWLDHRPQRACSDGASAIHCGQCLMQITMQNAYTPELSAHATQPWQVST